MQNPIRVAKIELYDKDPYYRYAIVTLDTGEKFAVFGELDGQYNKFRVKEKRGSITPYEMQFGILEEYQKIYNSYLENKIIEIKTVNGFKIYSLTEKYENAIADAILEHAKSYNIDTVIEFSDYQRSHIPASEPEAIDITYR